MAAKVKTRNVGETRKVEARKVAGPVGLVSMPYSAGLDGLRAIAVVAVLLYHADVSWLAGGFLGVEVFFVISGYLITVLLLQEWRSTGTVDLQRFWVRRARRLLPAVAAVMVGAVVMSAVAGPDALDGLFGEIVGATFYVTNWLLVFQDQSYFESFGRPSPLKHLWSLAVEEQFYLVWPLVISFGLAWLGRVRLLVAIGVGVVASTAAMWLWFEPFVDPSRLYYGTDTRAAGLLVGAGLGFVWQPWNATGSWVRERGRRAWFVDGVGVAALVAILTLFVRLSESSDRLYRGGFLITAVVTAALIGATMVPSARIGRWLGTRPMQWVGQRSYAIYLWHWPIFVFTRPRIDTALDGPILLVIRLLLTVLAAELSYRLIEQPVRHGVVTQQLRVFGRSLALGQVSAARAASYVLLVAAAIPSTILVVQATVGTEISAEAATDPSVSASQPSLDDAPPPASPVPAVPDTTPTDTTGPVSALVPGTSGGSPTVQEIPPTDASALPVTDTALPGANSATAAAVAVESAPAAPRRVVAIGDSVMHAASNGLAGLGIEVDTKIGRQWWAVADDLGVDPGGIDAAVVHLGHNGAPSTEMVDGLIARFGSDVPVFFVTLRAPVRWEGQANQALVDAAQRWPNVRLIDWRTISNEQWSWFADDGIHLTFGGIDGYVAALDTALRTLG